MANILVAALVVLPRGTNHAPWASIVTLVLSGVPCTAAKWKALMASRNSGAVMAVEGWGLPLGVVRRPVDGRLVGGLGLDGDGMMVGLLFLFGGSPSLLTLTY
ncbi:hypothetical protein GXW78_24030 [Roseomonas terrae]|uniref:Uncharacterized protein n=1 Tax=Neoroseomonas terrae TaxID=424799 RepID=A0ABS5EP08_9PROT|nr:hypothetical protein [Neoroseomonas terrae]